mgnify:CR=1 FL=1
MKVMLLSNMDFSGAGNAAVKIYRMLKRNNFDCSLYVNEKKTKYSKKFSLSFKERVKEDFRKLIYSSTNRLINLHTKNYYKSLGIFDSGYSKIINKLDYDIVQLHWINGFLSINDIVNINKPIIWRFSDFWPCSGIYHYENFENYEQNYFLSKINNFIKKLKSDLWNKQLNIITPSKWMENELKKSRTFKNYSVDVIYTPVNNNIFRKFDTENVRKKNGINTKKKILLFGADNLQDKRKGFSDVIEIFKSNYLSKKEYELITFGKSSEVLNKIEDLKVYNFGFIESKEKLNEIYNCADVMLITSSVDNLPQVGLEAQMSGLPLIVYNNSGLVELIQKGKTGLIAENKSIVSLSKQIRLFFDNENLKKEFSFNSVIRANKSFSENVVYQKYQNIYNNIYKKK